MCSSDLDGETEAETIFDWLETVVVWALEGESGFVGVDIMAGFVGRTGVPLADVIWPCGSRLGAAKGWSLPAGTAKPREMDIAAGIVTKGEEWLSPGSCGFLWSDIFGLLAAFEFDSTCYVATFKTTIQTI